MVKISKGLLGWAKEAKDLVNQFNQESKVMVENIVLYSSNKDSEENEKRQSYHAKKIRTLVTALVSVLKKNIHMPEFVDAHPFLLTYLDEPVSQGTTRVSKNITVEVFDFERPPFKLYYLIRENKFIWARLKGKGKWHFRPDQPDFKDVRIATDRDWCKYCEVLVLMITRLLPKELHKEIEVTFHRYR